MPSHAILLYYVFASSIPNDLFFFLSFNGKIYNGIKWCDGNANDRAGLPNERDSTFQRSFTTIMFPMRNEKKKTKAKIIMRHCVHLFVMVYGWWGDWCDWKRSRYLSEWWVSIQSDNGYHLQFVRFPFRIWIADWKGQSSDGVAFVAANTAFVDGEWVLFMFDCGLWYILLLFYFFCISWWFLVLCLTFISLFFFLCLPNWMIFGNYINFSAKYEAFIVLFFSSD